MFNVQKAMPAGLSQPGMKMNVLQGRAYFPLDGLHGQIPLGRAARTDSPFEGGQGDVIGRQHPPQGGIISDRR